jgi:hypothetical protein
VERHRGAELSRPTARSSSALPDRLEGAAAPQREPWHGGENGVRQSRRPNANPPGKLCSSVVAATRPVTPSLR